MEDANIFGYLSIRLTQVQENERIRKTEIRCRSSRSSFKKNSFKMEVSSEGPTAGCKQFSASAIFFSVWKLLIVDFKYIGRN